MEKIGWKWAYITEQVPCLIKLAIDSEDVISDIHIRHLIRCMSFPSCTHIGTVYKRELIRLKEVLEKEIGHYDGVLGILDTEYLCRLDHVINELKCRCGKARVLDIIPLGNKGVNVDNYRVPTITAYSGYDKYFIYRIGVTVYHYAMVGGNYNPEVICGPGIHYFEDWKAALIYGSLTDCDKETITDLYDRLFKNEVIFENGENS